MTKLWNDLRTEEISKEYIDSKLEDSFKLRVKDIKGAILMAEQLLQQSIALDYLKGQAYANCYLGYFNMICSQYEKSLKYSNTANNQFEKVGDKLGLGHVAYAIGSVHYKTDDTHLGLKYLLNSLQFYQQIDDIEGQVRALKAIGTMYQYLAQYQKAEETYLRSVDLSESIGDSNGKSNALNPLSGIYLKRNEIDKALSTIEESISLKTESGDIRGLAFALYGKAKVLTALGKFDEARDYYHESMETHREMNDMLGVLMSLNKIGYLHYKKGDFENAKLYLNECIAEGKKINHYLIMQKAYLTMYKMAKKEGNPELALNYYEEHISNKDRILNKDVKNVIQSIQNISKVEILEKETKWQKEINEKIESKNQELDKFVYKVSHDLRGPISSLMGLFSLVNFEVKDSTALKYFKIYNDQVNMLNRRLTGFIDLIQLKEKTIERQKIHFRQLVDENISSFNFLPNFEKTKFEIDIQDDIDFDSDLSAVNTIIQNLIENSIKYSAREDSPLIKINVYQQNPHVFLIVEDNGEGIAPEHQEKIFDMFYRASIETKGTGLGLYLLKQAVTKLKGEFSLESFKGKGTKFIVRL